MKKLLLLTLILFIVFASTYKLMANPENFRGRKENYLVYKSTANGVAEILLTIKPNHRFTFYMRIIPQPMTEDKESKVKSSGRCSQQDNWMRLTFKGRKLIIDALFDEKYSTGNEFRIINKRTVDLNTDLEIINIWGVPCVKQKN